MMQGHPSGGAAQHLLCRLMSTAHWAAQQAQLPGCAQQHAVLLVLHSIK
jgi:hypothetical protein